MPSMMESKNFDNESNFEMPDGSGSATSTPKYTAILPPMTPTFKTHVIDRSWGVDENFGGPLLTLLHTQFDRALAFTVSVDCEFEVVFIFVPKGLPQKWDMFALVYKEGAGMIDILVRPAFASCCKSIGRKTDLMYPTGDILYLI